MPVHQATASSEDRVHRGKQLQGTAIAMAPAMRYEVWGEGPALRHRQAWINTKEQSEVRVWKVPWAKTRPGARFSLTLLIGFLSQT